MPLEPAQPNGVGAAHEYREPFSVEEIWSLSSLAHVSNWRLDAREPQCEPYREPLSVRVPHLQAIPAINLPDNRAPLDRTALRCRVASALASVSVGNAKWPGRKSNRIAGRSWAVQSLHPECIRRWPMATWMSHLLLCNTTRTLVARWAQRFPVIHIIRKWHRPQPSCSVCSLHVQHRLANGKFVVERICDRDQNGKDQTIWISKSQLHEMRLGANYLPADMAVTSSTLGTFFLPPNRAVFRKFVRQRAAVPCDDRRQSDAVAVKCSIKYGSNSSEQPKYAVKMLSNRQARCTESVTVDRLDVVCFISWQ